MVAQLSEKDSSTFIGILTCIGKAAAEFALRFSVDSNISAEQRKEFPREMVEFLDENCRGYGTKVDVRENGIRVDANYAILVINVFSIEALGRRIFPSYNVLDAAWPLLQTYRRFVYQSDGLEHVARVEL